MPVICGKAYLGKLVNACIKFEGGKIIDIKKDIAGEKIDYGNAVIFPSAIDVHVHFREPGFEYKEDFFTGTKAAAIAGVTCILDMPNNEPAIISKKAFDEKVKKIKNKACIDYALYGGIKDKVEEMDCIAYKIFLSRDNEMFCSLNKLKEVLENVKKQGKPLAIHAELEDCISREKAKNLEEHNRNRAKQCEIEAVKKVLEINSQVNTKIHFCHITTWQSAELINKEASVGVTLHHLLFSAESKFKIEAFGKVNPPLRNEEIRKKLYNEFLAGKIPILESDHAPHLLEEKEDFVSAPSGMPGVDALLPIMLYKIKKREISLDLLHKMVCENPARFFGINKGSIEIGKDADFIVIDFKKIDKIKPLSKCGWSCYEGVPCIYPKAVYLRGEKIVEDGEFIGDKGKGRMIK